MWGVLIFLRFYYIAPRRRGQWGSGPGLGPWTQGSNVPRDVAQVGEAGIWQTLCAVLLSFAAAFCTTCVPWM